ncbi:hypothetical protein FUA48_13300 [Flavobacterium alkalisoli]|uniref:DUF5723 domain-containing protein n=1 Tax=Flavobacterium alkalisoli TaxID=2602769 RepID=A0A5B9FUF2_9FLAO|nr:hypothetical protein [Flavobacterium alkalisoli]QEE50514.1 hypothetical protein FUA48_13300 [Flavobacterium alkalisoli]
MKRTLLLSLGLLATSSYAQEHFSGINTSRRTGILNASLNPAELVNLKNDNEVNVFTFSANVSNNKISFGDLVGGEDLGNLIFTGSEPVNMRADVEILGPSFAMKYDKWAFAVTTGAKIKASLVDIDVNLGDALANSGVDALLGNPVYINTDYNQRAASTAWGEIGFSAAREIFENDTHKFSGGATFKLIFPGTYANMSADKFNGTIEGVVELNSQQQVIDTYVGLTDATANVNLAYSGALGDSFTDSSNFSEFFAGGLNGFSADLGANYQWKNENGGYNINAGVAVRNIGSMTFKDDNNVNKSYEVNVPNGQYLNLDQFEDVDNIDEVEEILVNSGYATLIESGKDFKIKQPTVLSLYADANVYNNWYVTAYLQQKLSDASENNRVGSQNIFTVTPRYSTNFFEAYAPFSSNEISGFTAGIGFRIGGFFIGSGSILSAAIGDTTQADGYLGFRFGF